MMAASNLSTQGLQGLIHSETMNMTEEDANKIASTMKLTGLGFVIIGAIEVGLLFVVLVAWCVASRPGSSHGKSTGKGWGHMSPAEDVSDPLLIEEDADGLAGDYADLWTNRPNKSRKKQSSFKHDGGPIF
eukprot:g2887.t1